jgi:uncharacterized protein YecT (DUF1311 family)
MEGGGLVFIAFALGAALVQVRPQERLCDDSGTTVAVNACLANKLKQANDQLDRYLQAALHKYASGQERAVRLGIEASQKAFEAYRSIECRTVFEDWKDGTIRGSMELGCEIGMTDDRTHDIWRHWLEYIDSTPPILPEPKPTK